MNYEVLKELIGPGEGGEIEFKTSHFELNKSAFETARPGVRPAECEQLPDGVARAARVAAVQNRQLSVPEPQSRAEDVSR